MKNFASERKEQREGEIKSKKNMNICKWMSTLRLWSSFLCSFKFHLFLLVDPAGQNGLRVDWSFESLRRGSQLEISWINSTFSDLTVVNNLDSQPLKNDLIFRWLIRWRVVVISDVPKGGCVGVASSARFQSNYSFIQSCRAILREGMVKSC